EDAGRPDAAVPPEMVAELSDVRCLLPEIQFLLDPHAELPDHVRECADVVVRREHVQDVEDTEGDVEVEGDHLLDPGAQHLDGDLLTTDPGAVDLTQARRRDGLDLEVLEGLLYGPAEFRLEDRSDRVERLGRHAVLQRADRREVRLGDDVGAGAEDLGELDEGRPERGDRRGQSLRPLTVGLGASSEGAAEDDPAPAVPQERDDERCQAPDDDESPAPAFHSRSAEARPRRRKKPARSVRVVTKIDDATAGSTPRRSSRIGTKAP